MVAKYLPVCCEKNETNREAKVACFFSSSIIIRLEELKTISIPEKKMDRIIEIILITNCVGISMTLLFSKSV